LQLVNAIDPATGKATNFSPTDESMVTSLASQAAIALTRKQLIDGLEELLKSLVQLVANAIDDKSPHTGGHCRRVPEITMALADAVNNCNDQLYGETRFNYRELQELEMAAWLHDCGKIITPDHIIDKQSKLETVFDRIDLIDARLNILRLEAEKAHLQAQGASETGVLEKTLEEIEQMRQFIHQCNTGGEFLSADKIERIGEIANYTGCKGAASLANPLLNDDEVHNLSISKGTLTEEERQKINDHAGISMRMLSSLPFPEHLQNIPEIAGSHHERMDGKGYPRSVPAAELPLQARIIAIADIFEALTASDRGYRKPNTLSEALKIMTFMCKEGHLDPELFDLFVSTEAYLDYASKQMQPEQRDQVDIASIRQNIQKTED
ncbi:MAG: HD domain-containing protein, partial [Desulfuromonadales bacterium]|nr:HD domain-containing protein [Desulfuromonadales bacterium]